MTDNEKAATYMGWVRKECLHNVTEVDPRRRNVTKCLLCGCVAGDDCKHFNPAPNMKYPEAYMAALEFIAHRKNTVGGDIGLWPIINVRHIEFNIQDFFGNSVLPSGGFSGAKWRGETLGDIIVKGLAEFYDTEHPEER